eukprot:gene28135-33974_t
MKSSGKQPLIPTRRSLNVVGRKRSVEIKEKNRRSKTEDDLEVINADISKYIQVLAGAMSKANSSASLIVHSNSNDEDEDGEEEDTEEEDDNEEIDISKMNVSPNLLKLMGIMAEEIKTDWAPPSRPGLQNSDPLAQKGSNGWEVRNRRAEQDQRVDFLDQDEDEDEDEDGASDIYNDVGEEAGEDFLSANMSPELARLLGLPSQKVETNWTPPSRPGLENSRPIVPPAYPSRASPAPARNPPFIQPDDVDDDGEDEDDYDDDGDEADITQDMGANMSASLRAALGLPVLGAQPPTDWVPPARSGLSNSAPLARGLPVLGGSSGISYQQQLVVTDNYGHGDGEYSDDDGQDEDEDNYGDDDDDDDDDEQGDDAGTDFVPSGGMSLSLMRALGLVPEGQGEAVVTDWTPPSHPGLNNSRPLMQKV